MMRLASRQEKLIMNALYCCCIENIWTQVAAKLSSDSGINPKYFIGWKDEIEALDLPDLMGVYLHTVEDAWKGLGFPEILSNSVLDEELIEKYSFEISNGIKMIDRLDPNLNSFSYTERYYWFIGLIEKWLGVIDLYQIDIVISPSVPHRVFDYALYIACKIKSVKVIMLQMTPFGDYSFIIDDVKKVPDYIQQYLTLDNKQPVDLEPIISTRLDSLLGDYSNATPDYMKEQHSRERQFNTLSTKFKQGVKKLLKLNTLFDKANTYKVKAGYRPHEYTMTNFELQKNLMSGRRYKSFLRTQYDNLIDISNVDFNIPFVLVALHYQPEETSCPTGGVYAEQRQIIKLLDSCLPDNTQIVVKEHTTQFHPDFEGDVGRHHRYYQDIKQISDRVKLISTSADTFSLLDSAQAVVTISGTIGWEAVFRGTPALIFGRAWYENMPGVFKVKSSEELVLALNSIADFERPSIQMLLDFHKKLSKFFISSIHYKAFQNKSCSNVDESVINLVKGINDHLNIINEK